MDPFNSHVSRKSGSSWRFAVKAERRVIAVLLLIMASVCAACGDGAEELEHIGRAHEEWGGTGSNNIRPDAFQQDPLKRSTTDSYGITTSTRADPGPLCEPNTGGSGWCYLKSEWETWRSADAANRNEVLKGIAKCSVDSSFELRSSTGETFQGQWAMFPDWRDRPLTGVASRERVSACLLSLVNAANQSVSLCIIGPGAGFDAPCSDPRFNVQEAGFFGDLFRESPTAYITGPEDAWIASDGRVCANNSCCREGEPDFECNRRLTRAGTITGAPPNYETRRCSGDLVRAGTSQNYYCTEFFSVEEEYKYHNGFTSFIEGP